MMALATSTPHLIDRLPRPRGRLTADAALGPQTWFRAGGVAEVLFRPADVEDLATFIDGLDIGPEMKAQLRNLRPETYTGLAGILARK